MKGTEAGAGSLAAEAYAVVRRRIVRGELAMGQGISRRQLAAELGMSFLPVSEAMLRLEFEGLLESRPRAGTRVRIPSREDVTGHYVVREALESQAAVLFAARATVRERSELARLAVRVDQGVTDGDWTAYPRVHHKLHRRIAECTNCRALIDAIDKNNALSSIWLCVQPVRRADAVGSRHQQLVADLCSGSSQVAAAAVREHLRVSLEHTVVLLEPYFELRKATGITFMRSHKRRPGLAS